MADCKRYKVAAIDLGTVSSRLVLAQVEGGAIVGSSKHTEITDLGEGVDATGRFCEAAVERVLAACRMFVDEARAFGAACIYTTCTSGARDASNAALLLDGLRELGLEPQVIPGRGAPDVFWRGARLCRRAHHCCRFGRRIHGARDGRLCAGAWGLCAGGHAFAGHRLSPCDGAIFLGTAARTRRAYCRCRVGGRAVRCLF